MPPFKLKDIARTVDDDRQQRRTSINQLDYLFVGQDGGSLLC